MMLWAFKCLGTGRVLSSPVRVRAICSSPIYLQQSRMPTTGTGLAIEGQPQTEQPAYKQRSNKGNLPHVNAYRDSAMPCI